MKLVKDIGYLVTVNPQFDILRDAWLTMDDGWITDVGTGSPPAQDYAEIIDARHGIALPGLINTHHHIMQNYARAYKPIANASLLPWIKEQYKLWRDINQADMYAATRMALAELMLTGCTTVFDHQYLFPQGATGLVDGQFAAAEAMGARFLSSHGAIDDARDELPPWVNLSIDTITHEMVRLTETYHDTQPGSMRRMVAAPCAPLTSSNDLLKEMWALAQQYDLKVHTHASEVEGEVEWTLDHYHMRPIDHLYSLGWEDPDRLWLAHSIHLNDHDIQQYAKNRVGVAHCPSSNMRLGSGICRVPDLRQAGCPVGIGVDGSASNDSGHMLGELRQALFINRVCRGAEAMTVEDVITMATIEGARILGLDHELGSLEVGKCADIAVFPQETLFSNGAQDPVDGLLLCYARMVDTLIVHGRIRVRDGQLVDQNLQQILDDHRKIAQRIQINAPV